MKFTPFKFEIMLEFKRMGSDVLSFKNYFEKSPVQFCDLSVGVRYMWKDAFAIDYCFYGDTLIMKESVDGLEDAFYYPIGDDVDGALCAMEKHCLEKFIPLRFCCIDNYHTAELCKRYANATVYNEREWSDYIYDANKFKTYSGKKLSGQRNHVNKFKRLYPDYVFRKIEEKDIPAVKEFLEELNKPSEVSMWTESAEEEAIGEYIDNMFKIGQFGGVIEVDGNIVALSIGEVVNDTLIVHVEKGNKAYDGVYPTMAQEFAKAFAGEGVKYINREEDCGDNGLRISKLQYQPIEVKEKNVIVVKTLMEKITPPTQIQTDRLTITEIEEKDKDNYFKLYTDDQLNKYWGYDYREDLGDAKPTPEYFYLFQKKMKDSNEEYSFAVRKDGEMIGELVLHNFDFYGGVEMGFRFFAECQGKGYALESASALRDYVIEKLKPTVFKSRCDKRNEPSRKLIERLGLKLSHQSDTHYFFEIKL